MKSYSNYRHYAFSFVELMLVLSITGILLAFAAPSLLTLRSTGLTAAGREFGVFLNQIRSEAISKRNAMRIGIVVESDDNNDAFRKYAAWNWDKVTKSYRQYSNWRFLPGGAIFDNSEKPSFLSKASYSNEEKSSIRGDYVLTASDNTFDIESSSKSTEKVRFFTFTPSGRADLPMGEKRNIIIILREEGDPETVRNWIQFNVDNLTGRTLRYRP